MYEFGKKLNLQMHLYIIYINIKINIYSMDTYIVTNQVHVLRQPAAA